MLVIMADSGDIQWHTIHEGQLPMCGNCKSGGAYNNGQAWDIDL